MAGTIRPNDINVTTTPTMASAALPSLDTTASSKKPTAPRTPRIDVEPLYAAVKGAITDADWIVYKKTISFFLLGNLNQEELSRKLKSILPTRELEHAHNTLIAAIYANVWRDAPEAGIASWVSSNDKPSIGQGAKGTGDESEKRLKVEVMGLSRRERKRLKGITNEGGIDSGVAQEYVEARRAKQIDVSALQVQGSGGFGKTNWDLEIRKRYTAALSLETHEFPTATSISHRLLPICYESGLPQGHAPDCPDFLNIATETFIKEALSSLLGKVSQNGAGYVRTGAFKKKVAREERMVDRGELARGVGGELPVEADERRKRKLLCMEDLRLALQLGDGYLGQTPFIAGSIMNSRFLDTPHIDTVVPNPTPLHKLAFRDRNGVASKADISSINAAAHKMNGANHLAYTGGETWTVDLAQPQINGDPMQIDDEFTWQGGSVQDVEELDGALDDILSLGDI